MLKKVRRRDRKVKAETKAQVEADQRATVKTEAE
jgi:hypothetical protein